MADKLLPDYAEAKAAYEKAKGETRVSERVVECPVCGAPMTKRTSYRAPEQVRVEVICSADAKHSEDRYGYSQGSD